MIFLAIEMMGLGYREVMEMPIGLLDEMIEWKTDLQKKQIEEIENELGYIRGKEIRFGK